MYLTSICIVDIKFHILKNVAFSQLLTLEIAYSEKLCPNSLVYNGEHDKLVVLLAAASWPRSWGYVKLDKNSWLFSDTTRLKKNATLSFEQEK